MAKIIFRLKYHNIWNNDDLFGVQALTYVSGNIWGPQDF